MPSGVVPSKNVNDPRLDSGPLNAGWSVTVVPAGTELAADESVNTNEAGLT